MPKSKNFIKKHASQTRRAIPVRSLPSVGMSAGIALITVVALIAYFPSLSGGFIWDDHELITDNLHIKAANGIYSLWFSTNIADYWPVTNTSFWIEWHLWGMNSMGYRISNLILHIVESLLIWIILRRLSLPGAFLAALIFAVHPVNVESVAWIAQRKNTMAMLFFLLSILCYLKFLEHARLRLAAKRDISPADLRLAAKLISQHSSLILHPSSFLWYWLSLAAFVLAMLSKGSVAVLPVLILGIIWWMRPLTRRDILLIGPFFVVAAALTGVNMWFQTHGMEEAIRTAGLVERLLGAGSVAWFYLYKAFVPINLAFIYPQWRIEVGNPLWWLPLTTALLVTAVLWRFREGWSRPILFAWGFFCAALLPVMGLTDVYFMKYSLVADHYQHIAIIAVITLASAGFNVWRQQARQTTRRASTVVAVVVVGILAFLTWRQSGLYSDEIALYQDTLKKNPNCWMAHNNLGIALVNVDRVREAIEHYRQALKIRPDYPVTLINLGSALTQIGRPDESIELCRQALKLKPNYPGALVNLGLALTQTGRPEEAIELCRQALKLNPNNPEALANLGSALAQMGRSQEAIEYYQQALVVKNDYPHTHNNLALILEQTGRLPEAIEHYRQALALKSDYAEVHYNLGNALIKSGRPEEAIEHYKQAIRLKPDYVDAHNNLGNVLIQTGRLQEAIEQFSQALALRPDYTMAHNNLATVLVRTGHLQEGIEHFKKAIQFKPDYIEAYTNLASAYAQTNRAAEALATAQKALDIARSKGQEAQAQRIEGWLNSYRAGPSDSRNAPPPSKSTPPTQ